MAGPTGSRPEQHKTKNEQEEYEEQTEIDRHKSIAYQWQKMEL
jgi:nitrate/TMAO reductase-like tetraheme cytochrome c subunit